MAGFKTHIATSTVLGIGYGALAYTRFQFPLDQCLLATGLCSVSGMLPDVDSDTGVPLRESLAFAAAVVPMLLIERFRNWGLSTDAMVLFGSAIYLAIRFGFGAFLRSYTVHRGMFHSIPAGIIFAELAYLICDGPEASHRLYKGGAVLTGFFSHLLLDEIWSIEWKRGRWQFKKSFGTAIKFWSQSTWANVSTYGKLAILTLVVIQEPQWRSGTPAEHQQGSAVATQEDREDQPGQPASNSATGAVSPWWESLWR
jgi:hypothetical protein